MNPDAFLPSDQPLLQKARAALRHAHAPYSRFQVGAAVSTVDANIHVGANVENASYGLSMCAERVAIFTAITAGARKLEALALSTRNTPGSHSETMPCGACRQVMAEFMDPSARVLIDRVGAFTLGTLLPLAFRLNQPV